MEKKLAEKIQRILNDLNPRQKEILEGRLGLNGKKLTLSSLGKKFDLTRERIRQIENEAIVSVRKKMQKDQEIEEISRLSVEFIKNLGGVRREDVFVNDLQGILNDKNINSQQIRFVFEILGSLLYYPEDKDFYSFWAIDKKAAKKAVTLSKKFRTFTQNKKDELINKKNLDIFVKKITKSDKINDFVFLNCVSISKKFQGSPYGDFGLAEWEEIFPKTTREKAYLVIKKAQKPLHFKEITDLINKAGFDGKKAYHQTVHNELIKDKRFVLVGRGTYALSEFGYAPGTAKEIIADVLKKNGPLTFQEIVDLVKQQRFIKDNTILINLSNKKYFRKLKDGRYYLVEEA